MELFSISILWQKNGQVNINNFINLFNYLSEHMDAHRCRAINKIRVSSLSVLITINEFPGH